MQISFVFAATVFLFQKMACSTTSSATIERVPLARTKPFLYGARFVTLLTFSSPLVMGQQQRTNVVQRDSSAISQVSGSILAMGGSALYAALTDTLVSGHLLDANTGFDLNVMWKTRGLAMRREVQTSEGTYVSIVSGVHANSMNPRGRSTNIPARTVTALFPVELPGLELVRLMQDQTRSFQIISDTKASDGRIHVQIQVPSNYGSILLTRQDWYFDSVTKLPLRVEFVLPDSNDVHFDGAGAVEYASWQSSSGMLLPHRITSYSDGKLQTTAIIDSVSFNSNLPSNEFHIQ